MNTFVGVALALLAVAFVAYPMLGSTGEEWEDLDPPEDLEELYRRKESTYSAIKELEFDFRTGKLSEADFHELDTGYRAQAVELIDAIKECEGGSIVGGPDSEAPVVDAAGPDSLGPSAECEDCSAPLTVDHRFCALCGAEVALQQGARYA